MALFGLLVADASVGGSLLGLVLASHVALGLGLFALYLDRLPGGLGGDAGFQAQAPFGPRVNLGRRDGSQSSRLTEYLKSGANDLHGICRE